MDVRRSLAVAAAALVLAAGCEEPDEREAAPAPPSAESVSTCLEGRDVPVREKRKPSFGATAELVVAEREGLAVGVLFYPNEGAVRQALTLLRIVGDPTVRVGYVIVVPGGPQFVDAQGAVLECVGAGSASPAP